MHPRSDSVAAAAKMPYDGQDLASMGERCEQEDGGWVLHYRRIQYGWDFFPLAPAV
jgi:hypothetical protein